MNVDIYDRLYAIEHAYHDGATYEALCEQIHETATLIARLKRSDPVREATEVFAPLLWGGKSGSAIQPQVVKAALAGPDGAAYLQSWSGIGRGLRAYRIAA